MNNLIDTHCHLNFPQFRNNLDEIVERAIKSGISKIVTISIKLSEINDIISITNKYSHIYNSVGVHPHECKNYQDLTVNDLIKYTKHPKCIGIGETGLDYYYENSPKKLQKDIFTIHIEAARKSNLPLIVHTRNADADTIEILQTEMKKGQFKGLIHCFSTTKELADKAIKLGLYISLAGIITFNKANNLRDIVKSLPIDRLLVETDSPYLAPEPHRGKCNEPSYVKDVAIYISNLLGLSFEEFSAKTTENFYNLFDKVNK